MKTGEVKLRDIPQVLLPVITSNKKAKLWLNGNIVEEIFIFRDSQYRINTDRGQFRYDLDTDLVLDIKTY